MTAETRLIDQVWGRLGESTNWPTGLLAEAEEIVANFDGELVPRMARALAALTASIHHLPPVGHCADCGEPLDSDSHSH